MDARNPNQSTHKLRKKAIGNNLSEEIIIVVPLQQLPKSRPMTKISAYTALQKSFGNEQAKALAEFVESQEGLDFSKFATKNNVKNLELKLTDLELRLTKVL